MTVSASTSAPQPNHATHRQAMLGLAAIFVTQFISFLFINARNIAQPGTIAEFDGMALFAWFLALPALTGSAATLVSGKLSDIYGRRNILLLCMAIFLVGLGFTARSTSMIGLIISTTLMSIGHWPIAPLCTGAVADLFEPTERARWLGWLNVPMGLAAAFGPVLGGILTDSAWGWRGMYWLTIILLLGAGAMVATMMPRPGASARPKLDLPGIFLMMFSTSTLVFGVSWAGDPALRWYGFGLLAISVVAWWGFFRVEQAAAEPILEPEVMLNRVFRTTVLASTLAFFGIMAFAAYGPIYAQTVMGQNPTISGSMQTPYTMVFAFIGLPAGLLVAKTQKYKVAILASYLMAAMALAVVYTFTAQTPIWVYILVSVVAGTGLGASMILCTLAAQSAMPRRLVGIATGALFFFQMVGISVEPALLGVVMNAIPDPAASLRAAFLAAAVALMASFALALTLPEYAPVVEE